MGKSMWTPDLHLHRDVGLSNFCHKGASTQLSRMSLYAVALRISFAGTKRPKPGL